jgi:hypothetical protein
LNAAARKAFVFFASKRRLDIGSYRIWIRDLQLYLGDIGCRVAEVDSLEAIQSKGADVIIVSKNDYLALGAIKKSTKAKVGIVNPERKHMKGADFAIVGSVEERLSLLAQGPAIIFPLIERQFQNVARKVHSDTDTIVIGYHGNMAHTARFDQGLKQAIELFSDKVRVKFKVIVPSPHSLKSNQLPKGVEIEAVQWDLETIEEELTRIDIGVVPNLSRLSRPIFSFDAWGLYPSDYRIRFKNKSNAGRSFVFIQMGIPVIADITPSNLSLGWGSDGLLLAADVAGWLDGLNRLRYAADRSAMSEKTLQLFRDAYDPLHWAENLYKEIDKIKVG